jgi:hypothetical protein
MLSHPLPPSLPLSSMTRHFLTFLTNELYLPSYEFNIRAATQSEDNLRCLYTLLACFPETLSTLLSTRTVHSILSKCLVHQNQQIKFLTIASLAKIALFEQPSQDTQDHPQSLFEGTKGTKVLKLVISTVLSAVSTSNFQIIDLCTVALEAIDFDVLNEWVNMKGSAQQLGRFKEKAGNAIEREMLQAVPII